MNAERPGRRYTSVGLRTRAANVCRQLASHFEEVAHDAALAGGGIPPALVTAAQSAITRAGAKSRRRLTIR